MSRTRTPVEDDAYMRFTRRVIRAAGQRASLADPEALAELVATARAIDLAIIDAIHGMRDTGATWADIGAATGTSRQAAWEKWGKR